MKAYGCKRFQDDFDRSARTFRKASRRARSRVIDNKRQRTWDARMVHAQMQEAQHAPACIE